MAYFKTSKGSRRKSAAFFVRQHQPQLQSNLLLQDQLLIASQFEPVNLLAVTDQQFGLPSE